MELFEPILQDLENLFPGKAFISIEDICQFLGCSSAVIYNWNKRNDPKKRPPSLSVGKELRFPKRMMAKWLAEEQSRSG